MSEWEASDSESGGYCILSEARRTVVGGTRRLTGEDSTHSAIA